jgi:hypothetical protein
MKDYEPEWIFELNFNPYEAILTLEGEAENGIFQRAYG